MPHGDITIVVSSCDAYSDLWPPFFTILARCWPGIPYPVVLATESAECTGAPLPVRTLHPADATLPWTGRLAQVLGQIDTPYVLLLLDDFFFTGPINGAGVEACRRWMDEDPLVACFSFYPTTGNAPASLYPGFEPRPQTGLYRFNAQAGLWRRERLMEFLAPPQDAWQWEQEGNKRSFALKDTFYSQQDGPNRFFPYDYMRHGLIGGKWFADTPALFERYGIALDFARRGFYTEEDWPFLPSTISAFVLDSVLYWDDGTGYSEARTLRCEEVLPAGAFTQRYTLPPGCKNALRWDASTHRGFALEGLAAHFVYADGSARPAEIIAGNYTAIDGHLLFLQPDPQLLLPLPKGAPTAVELCGTAVCPVDESRYRKALAMGKNAAEKPRGLFGRRQRRKGGGAE